MPYLQFTNVLKTFDQVADYIPLLSSVTNLFDIFQKHSILPRLNESTVQTNHYYAYLSDKHHLRCRILLLPVLGNIAIASYDLLNQVRDNEWCMKQLVSLHGRAIQYASDRLKNLDVIICKAAKQRCRAYDWPNDEPFSQMDAKIILKGIKKSHSLINSIPLGCMTDYFFTRAFKINEVAIWEHTQNRWTKEMFRIAANHRLLRIEENSALSAMDQKILLTALKHYPNLRPKGHWLLSSENYTNNKDFIIQAIEMHVEIMDIVADDLKKNKNFIIDVCRVNGRALLYVDLNLLRGDVLLVMAADNCMQNIYRKGYFCKATDQKVADIVIGAVKIDHQIVRDRINEAPFVYDEAFIEFMKPILKSNGKALEYLPEKLKKDESSVLTAIENDITNLWYAHDSLKSNEDFMLKAIRLNYRAFEYVSEELQNNKDFIKKSIDIDGRVLHDVIPLYREDQELLLAAAQKLFHTTNEVYWTYKDRELLLDASKLDPTLLLNIKGIHALVSDSGFMDHVIKINPLLIQHADEKIRSAPWFMKGVVRMDGLLLRFASEKGKNNFDIVHSAVTNNGLAYAFASNELQKDKTIISVAILQRHSVINSKSDLSPIDLELFLYSVEGMQRMAFLKATLELLKDNQSFMEKAIQRNPLVAFVSDSPNFDKERKLAIQKNPQLLEFATDSLRNDIEVVLAAIATEISKINSDVDSVLIYASESIKKNFQKIPKLLNALFALPENERAAYFTLVQTYIQNLEIVDEKLQFIICQLVPQFNNEERADAINDLQILLKAYDASTVEAYFYGAISNIPRHDRGRCTKLILPYIDKCENVQMRYHVLLSIPSIPPQHFEKHISLLLNRNDPDLYYIFWELLNLFPINERDDVINLLELLLKIDREAYETLMPEKKEYEQSLVLECITKIPEADRSRLLKLFIPKLTQVGGLERRVSLLSASASIPPQDFDKDLQTLIDSNDDNLLFIYTTILPIFSIGDRSSLVEPIQSLLKMCKSNKERNRIFLVIKLAIDQVPPNDRSPLVKATAPFLATLSDASSISNFLSASRYFPLNHIAPFLQSLLDNPITLKNVPVNGLISQALALNLSLVADVHTYLSNQLDSLEDSKCVRKLADFIIDNRASFYILDDSDPLFQNAIAKKILCSQDSNNPKNPYVLFSKLAQLSHDLPQDFKLPSEKIEQELLTLNSETFLKVAVKKELTFSSLPIDIDYPSFVQLFVSFENRLLSLTVRERNKLLEYIQASRSRTFESLKKNFVDDAFIASLFTRGAPDQPVPLKVAQFFSIVKYLFEQSDVLKELNLFSEREEALLSLSTSIENCPGGKSEGISNCYGLLLKDSKIIPLDKNGSADNLKKGVIGRKYINILVQAMLNDSFSNIALFRELTDSQASDINQLAHQSIFVKNLIGSIVGLQHQLQFDAHTNTLYDHFFKNDLVITQKEVLSIFYRHFTPKKLIQALLDDSRRQGVKELEAEMDRVVLKEEIQRKKEAYASSKENNEDMLNTEIQILQKQLDSIKGAGSYCFDLYSFYQSYLADNKSAQVQLKYHEMWQEINLDHFNNISEAMRTFCVDYAALPCVLTEVGAKELLKAAGFVTSTQDRS